MNNNGIIKRAMEARDETEKAQELEQVQLAVITAIMSDEEKFAINLQSELNNIFSSTIELIEEDDVYIYPGGKQNYIINKKSKEIITSRVYWKNNGDGTITSSTGTILNIGDYINYDATDGCIKTVEKSEAISNGDSNQTFNLSKGVWRLLGEKNGHLQIISENNIGVLSLKGKAGYQYGINELNKICKLYGNGRYAKDGRSVTVDDINKITGYNPDSAKYGEGEISQYGNKVTYKINVEDGENYCYYKGSLNNLNYTKSNYSRMAYYEKNSWKLLPNDGTSTITIRSTAYRYYPETLNETSDFTASVGISHNSEIYDMLFGNTFNDNSYYWLASEYTYALREYIFYGLQMICNGQVASGTDIYDYLYYSGSASPTNTYGIKPVIELEYDINMIIDDEAENKYNTYNISLYE